MISAAGIPVIDTDVEALSGHATSLTAAGGAYAAAGADFHTTWQGLAAHYQAPEADYLFASTGPVRDTARSVGDDVKTVGSALQLYADEAREIQARLDALRGAAAEFEASVAGLPDWSADPAAVDRNNALLAQVNAAVLDFEDAQRRCANAIAALSGGPSLQISDGDGLAEAGEFGSTAAELNVQAGSERGVAWGRAAEPDDDAVEGGNWLAELGHSALDGIGLVPGVGELADGANAAWYAAEGDHVNAGLSAAGMTPFVGWAATGGKVVRRAGQSDDLPKIIGTLRDARRGKGNFGLGPEPVRRQRRRALPGSGRGTRSPVTVLPGSARMRCGSIGLPATSRGSAERKPTSRSDKSHAESGNRTATWTSRTDMRATIRHFHSPDCDLEQFVPEDPADVGVLVQIMAGPADGPGEESFDVLVLTPRWLSRWIEKIGPIDGRHHLFVNTFDWSIVKKLLTAAVEREVAPSWPELGERIGRIGKWEFEDYRE